MTTYAGTTQGVNQFMAVDALKQIKAQSVLTRMGAVKPIPKNNTLNYQHRRPQVMAATTAPLVEGVTPTPLTSGYDIITGTVKQYGNWVPTTDVIKDASSYPKQLQEIAQELGEQAIRSIERLAFFALRGGTSVTRSNGSARSDINTPVSLQTIRIAVQYLMNNQARTTKGKITAGSGESTVPVPKAYIAVAHPYLRNDIQNLPGFKPIERYARTDDMIEGNGEEIGTIDSVRVIISTAFDAFADAGGAKAGSGTTMLSTSGTNADVYPILIFGDEAFIHCGITGSDSTNIQILRSEPQVSSSDPLAQRGTIGWKTYHDTKIVNDSWMTRIECAATDLSA
jgi:N4-gp56 family major capsid protein